jgi:cupin superfamily acireductone dioxygenase involved in methionine salvage
LYSVSLTAVTPAEEVNIQATCARADLLLVPEEIEHALFLFAVNFL